MALFPQYTEYVGEGQPAVKSTGLLGGLGGLFSGFGGIVSPQYAQYVEPKEPPPELEARTASGKSK